MEESASPPPTFVPPSLDELAPFFPAYDIEAFIAAGGMGAVYKARQKSLDRSVAIKILPREFGEDAQFRASFEAEAKAMARLNHPNLISVYDFGDVGGMLYIIMEFVQGKALYYSARKKIIDPEVALPLVSSISRGLAHAHKGGIIHRDIKPANILLDTDATPKIGDFGLARPADLNDSEGIVFGTPGYTAPEVYHRQPVDQRSDIFSVGALLYELLVGKHPIPESTSMTTGLDSRIDAIIIKATHADPNQRYPDVSQFADALDALLPNLSGPKFAAPALATPAPRASTPLPVLSSQKKSATLPIFAVLALLIGAAVAFFAFKKDKPEAPLTEQPVEETKIKAPPKKKPKKSETERPKKNPRPEKEKTARNPGSMPAPKSKPQQTPKPEPAPTPPAAIADTLAELTTLQSELSSGQRNQFPSTSIEHNGSRFCLIETPSTWLSASSFATKYGAQLAVLTSPDDLAWAKKSFQPKTNLWLGASDAGMENKWHWIDGQPLQAALWKESQPDNSPSDVDGENYAALTPDSNTIEDLPQNRELPFLIEWKLDGTTPGSLDQQLTRTAATLAAKQAPTFPTGTRNIGGSRFLYIDKKLSWSQAKAFAEKAGGHLAVASNQEEADHLAQLLAPILSQEFEGCWIGAHRTTPGASAWTTVTGERFSFITWLPNQPDNSGLEENYLQYISYNGTLGHDDRPDSDDSLATLIIEWSHPSMRNMPDEGEIPSSGNPLIDQLALIRDGVYKKHARYYDRYHQKKEKLIKDFVKDATDELKDALDSPAAALAQKGIDYLKNIEATMDIPDQIPPGFGTRIDKKFKVLTEKQSENWNDYEPAFSEARLSYEKSLEAAITSATKNNDLAASTFLSKELKTIQENTHHHRNILRGEPLVTPTLGGKDTPKYAGRWESDGSEDKKVKIILREDGTAVLESHGGGQGTWAIQDGKDFAIVKINDFEIQVKANKHGLRARDQKSNRYLLKRVE